MGRERESKNFFIQGQHVDRYMVEMLKVMVRTAHAKGKIVWSLGSGPMADTFIIGTRSEFEEAEKMFGAREIK